MFDLQSLIKYLLEGLAVAVAAYLIPRKTVDYGEIALIALTASAVFAVLDQFAPAVAVGARQGAGFGIGFHQVGMGYEGFQNSTERPILGYDVNGVPVTDPRLGSTIVTIVTGRVGMGRNSMGMGSTGMHGGDYEGYQLVGYDTGGKPITKAQLDQDKDKYNYISRYATDLEKSDYASWVNARVAAGVFPRTQEVIAQPVAGVAETP